jgi:ABC-type sugar transport system ATPase subunit
MSTPMLETKGISKAFPGTQALEDVSFQVLPGEVHALVGENGAGKSTLTHILSGVLEPDSGETLIQGNKVKIHHPKEAQALGIGTVFQELSLIPNLSVAENVFPNRAPTRGAGLVNWGELYKRTEDLLEPFQVDIDPKTLVRHLNISAKQIVEIAKALSLEAKILLLDEAPIVTETLREKLCGKLSTRDNANPIPKSCVDFKNCSRSTAHPV